MNNITIGKYVKGNSYLYKLDPRFKIIASIILMVATFLIPARNLNSLYALLGFLGFLLLIVFTARLNFLSVLKGLQPVLFIALFTFIMQLIYNQNDKLLYDFNLHFSWVTISLAVLLFVIFMVTRKYLPLKFIYLLLILALIFSAFVFVDVFSFGHTSFKIYTDGLIKGAFFCLRILIIVIISTLLTISTSTIDINLGLEWLMHPLTWIKVPVSVISLMISLTLRFIPSLMLETDKIMKAQASRGIDFNEGNMFQKIKQILTLLIPIFAISITKAEDLANAMETRGYIVGAKRTSIDKLHFKFIDALSLCIILGVLAGIIYLRIIL